MYCCGYFLGNFWSILGYFLFQHSVTLFANNNNNIEKWSLLVNINRLSTATKDSKEMNWALLKPVRASNMDIERKKEREREREWMRGAAVGRLVCSMGQLGLCQSCHKQWCDLLWSQCQQILAKLFGNIALWLDVESHIDLFLTN